jgi:hypothetical protein
MRESEQRKEDELEANRGERQSMESQCVGVLVVEGVKEKADSMYDRRHKV